METFEALLNIKEDGVTELKEAKGGLPSSFYETYSAFANTRGGTVYLGIKEGKEENEIVGVKDPESLKRDLLSTVHNRSKVSADLLREEDIETIDVGGKKVLKIKVREAPSYLKPVYLNGAFNLSYRRKGDGDFLLSGEEMAYMVGDRRHVKKDVSPNSLGLGAEAVEKSTLLSYKNEMASLSKLPVEELGDKAFLERIGALVEDETGRPLLTNGAILFFGKWGDIIRIYPHYFLDYQYYERTLNERWSRRITSDELTEPGNLYNFFSRVRSLLSATLPNPFNRVGSHNIDGFDIFSAVLEALANAISNAAFDLPGGVIVKQSALDVTIRNPGLMPISYKAAKKGGRSEPRNDSIMTFFRFLNVVEKAGSGIPKIYRVSKEYGYREPSIEENEEFLYTEMDISFRVLPADAPSRAVKESIISYLSEGNKECSLGEIQAALGLGKSQVAVAVRDLLSAGLLKSNGMLRKGRKVSLA